MGFKVAVGGAAGNVGREMRHSLAHRRPDGSIRLDYKPVVGGPYIPMERKY